MATQSTWGILISILSSVSRHTNPEAASNHFENEAQI